MTTALTLARLRDLRLGGMAQALERQQEQIGTYDALPFLERLGLLVEQECLEREHRLAEACRSFGEAAILDPGCWEGHSRGSQNGT